jgi:hypothetical protein
MRSNGAANAATNISIRTYVGRTCCAACATRRNMWRKEVMAEPMPDDLVYILTTPAQMALLADLLAARGIRVGRLPVGVAGIDQPVYIMSPYGKFFGVDDDA